MKKKLIALLLTLALVCTFTFALTACNKNKGNDEQPAEKTTMLVLGDSIAEALAGPSPVSERENYGYYSLIGRGNGYYYINQSVSGWRSNQLLDSINSCIKNGDESAELKYTVIKNADIIEISILGNDLLQDNLGKLLSALAEYINEVKKIDGNGNLTLADMSDYIHEHIQDEDSGGSDALEYIKQTLYTHNKSEGGWTFKDNSTKNLAGIVDGIRQINPNAKILLQTIYNPVFDSTSLIGDTKIAVIDTDSESNQAWQAKYAGQTPREVISSLGYEPSQYRVLGDILIEMLNNVVRDYQKAHSDVCTIVEIHDYFEEYYNNDTSADKIYARRLYSQDYIHPSNEGHAFIAEVTQSVLSSFNLTDNAKYLATVKEIRKEQLNRMYTFEGSPVDVTVACAAVDAATTSLAANEAYFNAVTDSTYAARVAARDTSKPAAFYPWVVPNYANNY